MSAGIILENLNENVVGKMSVAHLSDTIWLDLENDSHWSLETDDVDVEAVVSGWSPDTTSKQYSFVLVRRGSRDHCNPLY